MTLRRLVFALFLGVSTTLTVPPAFATDDMSPPTAPHAAAAQGLKRLAFMIGEWDIHAKFGAAADGPRVTAKMICKWVMGGHALEMLVAYPPLVADRPIFYATSLFTGIPGTEQLEMVSTNSLANRKQADEIEYTGGFEGTVISFLQSGELFGGREGVNRLIFHDVGDGTFQFQQDASLDGDTWQVNTFSYQAVRR